MLIARLLLLGFLAGAIPVTAAEPNAGPPARAVAAVFAGVGPGTDTQTAQAMAAHAQAAGYAVQFTEVAALTDASTLNTARFDLVIVVNGRALPVESIEPLQGFLRQGGDLLALGTPLWDTPLFRFQDRWISRAEYEAALSGVVPETPLFDFSKVDVAKWGRSTNSKRTVARRDVVPTPHGPALHVSVEAMEGWETLASPPPANPFPAGHTLTCFRARGGAKAGPLMVEWMERDGSRWIATVELTPEWQAFALPPSAFHAWEPRGGRGGKGDSLRLESAARLTVGVALSHGAAPGAHEYWLASLGTARNPFGDFAPPAQMNLPRLESLSPGYQCYPVTMPAVVRPSHEKAPIETWEQTTNAVKLQFESRLPLLGVHPRPQGAGFDQGRPWRWEPLLGAYAARMPERPRAARGVGGYSGQFAGLLYPEEVGDYRGALGALVVHVKPPYFGSVWTCFTPTEPQFYQQPLVSNAVRQVLTRMNRGIFLVEAGTDQASADFPSLHEHRAGARVANFGRAPSSNLVVRVYRSFEPGFYSWRRVPNAEPGQMVSCPIENDLLTSPPLDERALALFHLCQEQFEKDDRMLLDRLFEPLSYRFDKPPPFLRIKSGGFTVDGAPWKAHGVNYMPSSGIGVTGDYFEHWLGRGAYDPWVIQRDLDRIKNMGLNAVSVFIYFRDLEAGHLFDFMRRCEALKLRVNLSLRPGTPMDFRWAEMKALIEHYRLASNSTVMAYDLAWEPSHLDHAYQQRHYTAGWREWVQKRYGTMEAARTAWGKGAGADLNLEIADFRSLGVPSAAWLTQDGPWRRLVADYRLFLDELVGAKYAEARRLIRGIDTNHPVSFRMQHAGDSTLNSPGLMPYDFWGLRDAVDLWEPEAYGRIGDWDRVKAGHFTADYARLCDPSKPVIWSEIGNTVWDPARMAPSPERIEWTARYYRDFYRMMIESGADGVFFWWYPGGYRLNERSDFGIINPDGTDRMITKVIREEGARFLAAPKPPAPNNWFTVDRDADARGLFGIYESVKAEYWKAVSEGKTPGLRWNKQPGAR